MAGLLRSGMMVVLAGAVLSISACGGASPTPSPSATLRSGVHGLSLVEVLAPTPAPQPYATTFSNGSFIGFSSRLAGLGVTC